MEKKRLVFILALFYLFIFSMVLIKESCKSYGYEIVQIIGNANPVNAFGSGWLLSIIMQSSGAATAAIMSVFSLGVLNSSILVYMIIGSRIGAVISAFLVSMLIIAKRRDFRHGFEIGLTNLIYALPIAGLMFIAEYSFSLFSKTGTNFLASEYSFNIDFINYITMPLINLMKSIPELFLFFLGILLLVFSLQLMSKNLFSLFDKDKLKKNLNKYFSSKSEAFLIGFVLTAIFLSTGITISLLVPLIVSRLINLKKAIPYMIGANLGGVIDVIISGLIIGGKAMPGVITYVSFSLIGLLWMFNTDLLFKITKYISKRDLHVSRKIGIFFVIFFILISIILSII